ncbi:polysaccharide deacetylase family protein [Asticcacaulis sp. BYS171W]|uniref:Chitooligosaccharide deacetylase n=1 Tax=Asticcacaulis aquaticus TaxID=2984212 RepID=A0ABT5HXY0_9CAUL|nr:polysaccharide deacetylase family protein [Asticcacaulis aquaticus]MDC7684710.1 polysaccharide deacetylase family protein [Asticcacaulis aquaticus]
MADDVYSADRSLYGKLRRRASKLLYRKPAKLTGLARPLLTFSFDDAPQSAATAGADIIEKHGFKATYFISAGIMGEDSHFGPYTTPEQVKDLHIRGHEIACHTFTHIDCGQASGADIAASVDQNQKMIQSLGLPASITFAYPYGDVSPQAKAQLSARYASARALHHGLITTGTDLNQAPAVGIEGADGETLALDWMRRAVATPDSWLVLYTHDVRENPSPWGCTPESLDRLARAAVAMGFEVVTYAEGAGRAGG